MRKVANLVDMLRSVRRKLRNAIKYKAEGQRHFDILSIMYLVGMFLLH